MVEFLQQGRFQGIDLLGGSGTSMERTRRFAGAFRVIQIAEELSAALRLRLVN